MSASRPVKRLDARILRAAGVHPFEQVATDLGALGPGEAYELVTPHAPDKLVARLGPLAFPHATVQVGPDEFVTTFTRGA